VSAADSTQRNEPPGLMEAVGGPLGMAETSLPPVAFAAAYGFTGTNVAAIVAVAVGLVFALARLARRETPRHALTGLVGIGFAAFVAARSGKAENFFLPGLLANAAYAIALLTSIAIRRPLIGYVVGQLDGEGAAWREDPLRVRVFMRASLMWAALFGLRLAVQLPLYLAGAVGALGVARTAMGIPLFALGLWLTYRLVRPTSDDAAG
jgi:xanthosine utilization system XapX-like protein